MGKILSVFIDESGDIGFIKDASKYYIITFVMHNQNDEWIWNEGRQSNGLKEKVEWLKKNNLWNKVRDTYLKKKNLYLRKNDHNHPSFICYIEAVNNIYNHLKQKHII